MEVKYTRTNWEDAPSTNTPVSSARLNNMEQCLVNLVEQLNKINNAVKFYSSPTPENPADIFGGKWERLKGRFLWGIEDGESGGVTGGEKTHTLTVNEIPAHTHKTQINTYSAFNPQTTGNNNSGALGTLTKDDVNQPNYRATISNEGGNKPHNNMPPYYGVYLWRRIS